MSLFKEGLAAVARLPDLGRADLAQWGAALRACARTFRAEKVRRPRHPKPRSSQFRDRAAGQGSGVKLTPTPTRCRPDSRFSE